MPASIEPTYSSIRNCLAALSVTNFNASALLTPPYLTALAASVVRRRARRPSPRPGAVLPPSAYRIAKCRRGRRNHADPPHDATRYGERYRRSWLHHQARSTPHEPKPSDPVALPKLTLHRLMLWKIADSRKKREERRDIQPFSRERRSSCDVILSRKMNVPARKGKGR